MKAFTRFIFESRHFSRENNRVKPAAFIPWPRFETSVAYIEKIDTNSIWTLGDGIGNLNRGLPALARGDFDEQELGAARLTVQIAEPPPRHWHLIGWDRGSKDVQKSQGLELATVTELHIR
jgi:hypothetical protein